jgi:predicted ATP-grasp superfamily ATP-dependent carboligase
VALIAVAAMSARMLAEAAVDDGFDVIALDLFGDADTRRAALEWQAIGAAQSLQIDDGLVLRALRVLARRGGVDGWVAGGGFEGRPELLHEAASLLPLLGSAPQAVARVRDPASFFGCLDSQGIAHPPVLLNHPAALPDDGSPWLIKDARGCGGCQVRIASPQAAAALPHHRYLQRQVAGVPMSATFIAAGRDALVLGFNELLVRACGSRPYLFCGALGPVELPPRAAQRVRSAVRALSAEFALQGLCSLDFMLDGDEIALLELNPRPPASMGLYRGRRFEPHGAGLMSAHLRACRSGELPRAASATQPGLVEGFEIVFAARALQVDDALASHLANWPNCHDLPCSGTCIAAGDPLCSLSAAAGTAPQLRAALHHSGLSLLQTLETPR